jgi:hypothetical protein
MSTMPIMTAAALAAMFAVSTAWAQQPTQRVVGTLDGWRRGAEGVKFLNSRDRFVGHGGSTMRHTQ